MRKINKIIIHCSASDNPNDNSLESIEYLHMLDKSKPIRWGDYNTHGKGFNEIGYHFVITKDGNTHFGRSVERMGAGCTGENADSIHICLTGNKHFTDIQFSALKVLKEILEHVFNCKSYPHNYYNKNKTCPNFDIASI